MARKGPATGRPRHCPLRLPAVEAAARRLEALLSDEQEDLVEPHGAEFNDDNDCGLGNDPLFDLEAREFGCAIALFQPSDEPYATYARNWIIPLLDGYGRVTHVTDTAFEFSEHGGDIMPLHGKRFEDAGWRRNVSDLVDTLDVAVVDTSNITDGLLWEMETCYRHLPSVRVIVIAYATSESDLGSHAKGLSESLAARHVNPGMEPVLPYAGEEALGLFAEALHVRMRDIVVASATTYEAALETAEKADDHPAMMGAYHGLGEAAYNLGNYRSAMDWFQLALVMAEAIQDRAATQRMHLRLQAAASAAGDDEQWLRSFEALGDIRGWKIPGH